MNHEVLEALGAQAPRGEAGEVLSSQAEAPGALDDLPLQTGDGPNGAPGEGLPFAGEKEEGGSGYEAFAASYGNRGSEMKRASSDAGELSLTTERASHEAPGEGLPFDGEEEEGGSGVAVPILPGSPEATWGRGRGSEQSGVFPALSETGETEHSELSLTIPALSETAEAERSELLLTRERASSDVLTPIAAHFAALVAEGAALEGRLPGFSLSEALADPAFLRLTAPGTGVGAEDAWCALHADQLRRQAARQDREALARAVSAGRLRPREGGGSGAVLFTGDPRQMSRAQRAQIRRRVSEAAARGEKIYP